MEFEIAIELLVVLIILLILFVWSLWYSLTKLIARWRYKPKNDKSKYGEERRRAAIEGRKPEIAAATISIPGPAESAERAILPASAAGSTGKDSKRFRGIFKRRH